MNRRFLLCALALALAGCSEPPAPAPPPEPTQADATLDTALESELNTELDALVDTFRRIIVLMSDEATLAERDRPRAFLAGKLLFETHRRRLAGLEEAGRVALERAAASGFRQDPAPVMAILDRLEQDTAWHDADKLPFRDLLGPWLDAVRAAAPRSAKGKALEVRLAEDARALEEIQALYEREIEKVFAQFGTRGIPVRREAWESYLAFLRRELAAQAIFDGLRATLPPEPPAAVPAGKPINGATLPEKTLVLTFDDGPHATHTPKILEILARTNTPAIFFAVGENLGRFDADGTFKPSRAAAAIETALAAGHLLANHTLSHAQLSKLDAAGIATEIDTMSARAKALDPVGITLFRPPYGAWNADVAALAAERKLRMMLWNIDSLDWSDPVASSIANRVVAEVRSRGRGIVLFHDIHARTVEALPLVIETLEAEGYRFVSWDGETLTEPRGPRPPAPPAASEPAPLYGASHAVVIGIDAYEHWPKLGYAVADALAVRELLVRRLGFPPENVHMLLDGDATRERILEVMGDRLADPARVGPEDRVVMFFAGHGTTRRLSSGRSLGYIVPVDADLENLQSQAISMTQFGDINETLPAKHVLYLMDACYGGLALLRGGAGSGPDAGNYLRQVTRRRARQMLTAGGADELVADGGPNGHSIFTWTLLQGLEGGADLNRDGYVAASELFAYTGPLVAQISKQTPAFGSLPGSEGGEVVFALEPDEEFLSAASTQLDEQAIALNQQLEQVRGAITEKRARNLELARRLQEAQEELARLSQLPPSPGPELTPTEQARERHERGLELYRSRRYDEALAAIREAVALEPASALYANNLGFLLFKRGEKEQALRWYRQAHELDPTRAIAFQNEGEALEALGRLDEARTAYMKFLELAPNHASAPGVRRHLKRLETPDR